MEWAWTPLALKSVLYLVAVVVLQLGLATGLGWLLLRLGGFRLKSEHPLTRLFAAGLTGSVLLPAAYTIWMLGGHTVAWGLVVGLPVVGMLVRRLGSSGPVLWQPVAQVPVRRLVPALSAGGLVLVLLFPAISVRSDHQPWRILDADNAFYAQCARFMEAGYAENDRIHHNALAPEPLPPTPYHYFEMWNAAWVARWSGLPVVMGLQGVHTGQFLLLTLLGLLVLGFQVGLVGPLGVVVAVAFCLQRPDFWGELLPVSWLGEIRTLGYYSLLGNLQPKLFHYPPLLAAALLLAGRGYWLAGLTVLVLFPFFSLGGVSLVPGLLIFVGVWGLRHWPLKHVLLAFAAWAFLGLTWSLFYILQAFTGSHEAAIGVLEASDYWKAFYPLQPVNIVGKSTLLLAGLFAVPIGVAWWSGVLQRRHWPLGLLIGLLVLSGLLSWAAAAPAVVADAVNFIRYALPLIALGCTVLVLKCVEKPRPWALAVLCLWLAAGVGFRLENHFSHGLRRSYYDPAFVAEVGRQPVSNPVGAWLPDTVGFKGASIFYQNLRIRWPFELVLHDQYLGAEALVDWPALVDTSRREGRWLAHQSVIFPFAQRLLARQPTLTYAEIEQEFVRHHRMEWLAVEPRREPPVWLEGRVRHVLTDPRSGTRMYYFRPLHENKSE